jgi:hypothetical protein
MLPRTVVPLAACAAAALMLADPARGNPVLRCSVMNGADRKEVIISLPEVGDRGQELWVFKDPSRPRLLHPSVGVGHILVTEAAADGKHQTNDYELVVSQMPLQNGFSLKGFYFIDSAIWIVYADTWSPARKSWLAGEGKDYTGTCE